MEQVEPVRIMKTLREVGSWIQTLAAMLFIVTTIIALLNPGIVVEIVIRASLNWLESIPEDSRDALFEPYSDFWGNLWSSTGLSKEN